MPYSSEQVVSIAIQLVFQTGLFLGNCKIWKVQAPDIKTCPAFKAFFVAAHQEWHECIVTTTGAGFRARLRTPYDSNHPIETLICQV